MGGWIDGWMDAPECRKEARSQRGIKGKRQMMGKWKEKQVLTLVNGGSWLVGEL